MSHENCLYWKRVEGKDKRNDVASVNVEKKGDLYLVNAFVEEETRVLSLHWDRDEAIETGVAVGAMTYEAIVTIPQIEVGVLKASPNRPE